jgi:hypothetical protein
MQHAVICNKYAACSDQIQPPFIYLPHSQTLIIIILHSDSLPSFLTSTYEIEYTLLVFLYLTSFTQNNALQFHPFHCDRFHYFLWMNDISLCGVCVCITFLYPFICWWAPKWILYQL